MAKRTVYITHDLGKSVATRMAKKQATVRARGYRISSSRQRIPESGRLRIIPAGVVTGHKRKVRGQESADGVNNLRSVHVK